MNATKELVLFRIIQEAINNIIKHAEASSILIKLIYNSTFFKLSISDDGKGFESKDCQERATGLKNMEKRAIMLHGTFQIISKRGIGTTILLEIPINEHTTTI